MPNDFQKTFLFNLFFSFVGVGGPGGGFDSPWDGASDKEALASHSCY